jgi:hypothetical protein
MTDAIRARLEDEMSYHRADCCGESDEPCNGTRMVAALRAVLDLCDQAPVNGDVGVMFSDEIEHVIAVALGLPGDPRHVDLLGVSDGI